MAFACVSWRSRQRPGRPGRVRLTADVFTGLALRSHRADAHDGPRRRLRRRSEEPERLLRRHRRRRPVEKREPRQRLGRRSSTAAASFNLCCVVSIRRTRTSSGSARARTRTRAARCSATASTSPPTPARRGRASASRTPSTSATSQIDPRNSNVVYVAAQGPLWSAGGDRGVYKTTDGGKTWKAILHGQRRTPARNEIADRSEQPGRALRVDVAAAPRRRASSIGGGPESGIYKSTNGGKTWTKLTKGLPKGDMGRIASASTQGEADARLRADRTRSRPTRVLSIG